MSRISKRKALYKTYHWISHPFFHYGFFLRFKVYQWLGEMTREKDFYFFMPYWSLHWQIIWDYHVELGRLSFIFFMFFSWLKCHILFYGCRFYSLHQKSAYVTPSGSHNEGHSAAVARYNYRERQETTT